MLVLTTTEITPLRHHFREPLQIFNELNLV